MKVTISDDLAKELKKRKMFNDDTYEGVIWDLIETDLELSEKTKKNIQQAREEFKQGKYYTLEEAKKGLNL
ncbi:MAG: hypothetical protein ABIA37_05305 [Candidatus Woesearchaeota archaeon]